MSLRPASYAALPERFFVAMPPAPVRAPQLLWWNGALGRELGLDPLAADVLAGNAVPEGLTPLAMAYAGQQFGGWSPQLGDGRAILLGEAGEPPHEVQLKGSGRTPFSRGGDGRAWLGPVLREVIVAEAMAALGVPTTRSLAATATGEKVMREAPLPGAVLTRVSRSHVRVGTFQFFAIRGDVEGLKTLTDYCVERLYPDLADAPNRALALLERVIERQAALVAHWMALGFIHGVMNTDNVSIAGETIDYGPCAFMDDYHAGRVFSSIDETGRYAYANQPTICHWNLVQFAQALLPLLGTTQEAQIAVAQTAVDAYPDLYEREWTARLSAKLGLPASAQARSLGLELLKAMQDEGADFTNTFRALGEADAGFLNHVPQGAGWLSRWRAAGPDRDAMSAVNPAIVPRNHRIEQVIAAALDGDLEPLERLTGALRTPFKLSDANADLAAPPAEGERVLATFCGT